MMTVLVHVVFRFFDFIAMNCVFMASMVAMKDPNLGVADRYLQDLDKKYNIKMNRQWKLHIEDGNYVAKDELTDDIEDLENLSQRVLYNMCKKTYVMENIKH